MKKIKLLGLVLSVFAILVLTACGDIPGLGSGPNSEIVSFIEENPTSLAPFNDVIHDFEAEAGTGNELILRADLGDAYEEFSTMADEADIDLGTDVITPTLRESRDFFIDQAETLRDEIGLDSLRLTIIYMGDGNELARVSFNSEQ